MHDALTISIAWRSLSLLISGSESVLIKASGMGGPGFAFTAFVCGWSWNKVPCGSGSVCGCSFEVLPFSPPITSRDRTHRRPRAGGVKLRGL